MPRMGVPAAAVLAATALSLGLSACGGDGGSEGGGQGLDIAGIQAAFDRDEPGTVTGKKATLTGQVDEVLSSSAFVIADDDEPLLVVAKDKRMPDRGDRVRVSGTVHEFEYAQVKKRLGEHLAKGVFDEHVGDPYLWAKGITPDSAG